MANLLESDCGSDLLDFDDLPDVANLGKPTNFNAAGSNLRETQQKVSHFGHSRPTETSSGEKALKSESEAAQELGDYTLDSDHPHDTMMSVADTSKRQSLFVHTSDSMTQASPDAKNSNGKRRNSDDLVGLDDNESNRMMSTKKPALGRSVIKADEFMISLNQDVSPGQKTDEKDGIYEWFAENFGFEHFNWVG
jgi:hypothetical protein